MASDGIPHARLDEPIIPSAYFGGGMIPHTMAGIVYIVAGVGVAVLNRIKDNPRTMDFEAGIAAGLGIAGVIDALTPWIAMLP